ncbi:replication initiator protein [Microvirus mar59]|uniref:Replication initiator protein n=1 Tax=Microvirus mar59 TaxID=2851195 RepID=A0A8F5RBW6_9VIRU|nr:replication initiator protein [Microvirus mar59]
MCTTPRYIKNPYVLRSYNTHGSYVNILGTYKSYKEIYQAYVDSPEPCKDNVENLYAIIDGCKCPLYVTVPCGKCKECCYSRFKEYESRLLIEASDYPTMFFCTATYDDKHLPSEGLRRSDIPPALKRLRIQVQRYVATDLDFRCFYVGEYGHDTKRPHYHFLLFFKRCLTPQEFQYLIRVFYHYKSFSEKNNNFENWWPHGWRRELQWCRNPQASARYVSKYLLKSCVESTPPQWKTSPFVQGPVRNGGLGCSKILDHIDSISNSTDGTMSVRIGDKYTRLKIPQNILLKLYPPIGKQFKDITLAARKLIILKQYLTKIDNCGYDCFASPHKTVLDLQSTIDRVGFLLIGTRAGYKQRLKLVDFKDNLYKVPISDIIDYASTLCDWFADIDIDTYVNSVREKNHFRSMIIEHVSAIPKHLRPDKSVMFDNELIKVKKMVYNSADNFK